MTDDLDTITGAPAYKGRELWREGLSSKFKEDKVSGTDERRKSERRSALKPRSESPIGHDEAQARIAECVREIEILCDSFGYDPAEWLVAAYEDKS